MEGNWVNLYRILAALDEYGVVRPHAKYAIMRDLAPFIAADVPTQRFAQARP